jgi:hypothetical protein
MMSADVREDSRSHNNRLMAVIIASILLMSLSILCSCQSASTAPTTSTPIPTTPTATLENTIPESAAQQTGEAGNWIADGVITTGEYQQSNTYGDLDIYWSNDSQYVCIGLRVKTAGWLAIGFGTEGLMKNMDIVEGLVKDGKTSVYDMFSTGDFGPHPADTQQGGTDDIIKSAASSINNVTVIEFKRKLDTGDKFDKPLIKGTNKVSWSYSTDSQLFLKHVARGYGEIVIK